MKLKIGKWYKCSDPDQCVEAGNKPYDHIISYNSVKKKFVGKNGDLYCKNGRYNDRNPTMRGLDLLEEYQIPPE